jgi:hypothetical protein
MANFSNTYETSKLGGSAASNREDLTDVLTILAPEETPVLSSANKQKANATFVEWTVDSLATPATAGIDEGADVDFDVASSDKFANRARLGNYVQKFRRYKVSDLQEAVDSVGPAKIAQAEAKSIRELKRDIEATLCGESDRDVEDGANQTEQILTFFVVLASGSRTPQMQVELVLLLTSLMHSRLRLLRLLTLLKLRVHLLNQN